MASPADPSRPTYRNAIIAADYSDPDAIRVGDTFWMTASSFNRAPGLPILCSRDLVHWEHVTNALPAVPPVEHYALPRRGSGVWAPSLRYHDGVFHLVYPDPDYGIWVLHADHPAGPWSAPKMLLPGIGRIDPCPLWDSDGRAYLVFGWAASRSGVQNRLSVVEVTPDLHEVIGPERVVVDGDALPGCVTLEGPKFYKRGETYWIFAPAGGVTTGWQSVFRAASPYGPYEHRVVLAQGTTAINGPHQGAWVDTPSGQDWFLHFRDREAYGRVVMLEPMSWAEDGWPTIGSAGSDGVGEPVTVHPVPDVAARGSDPCRLPSAGRRLSSFTAADGSLAPHWYWQANPRARWWRQDADAGIRLVPTDEDRGDLRALPNVLAQRLPEQECVVTAELQVERLQPAPGVRAGMVLLGEAYSWIGVEHDGAGWNVVQRRFSSARRGEEPEAAPIRLEHDTIQLRVEVADGVATWSWRSELPDGPWRDGWRVPIVAGRWVGTELGLFATRLVGIAPSAAEIRVRSLAVEIRA